VTNIVEVRQDNIISVVYHGDQTLQTIDELLGRIVVCASELRKKSIPIRLLCDNTDMGKRPPHTAWQKAISILHTQPFEKVAVFGADNVLESLGAMLLPALGLSNKFRYFKTEQEAENWLLAH
jgi:hypothetical protein